MASQVAAVGGAVENVIVGPVTSVLGNGLIAGAVTEAIVGASVGVGTHFLVKMAAGPRSLKGSAVDNSVFQAFDNLFWGGMEVGAAALIGGGAGIAAVAAGVKPAVLYATVGGFAGGLLPLAIGV